MKKLSSLLILFWTFFKIGLFTFGGGYSMIPFIEEEIAYKKKWMRKDEIFEIIVVSESTPGPVAVNMSTYVGFKVAGIWGAIFATLGLVVPSFVIIFLISLIFEQFLQFEVVQKAFQGIKIGVIVLLVMAVIKLSKGVKRNLYFYIASIITITAMILFAIFLPSFSFISIILIVTGLFIGVLITMKGNKA